MEVGSPSTTQSTTAKHHRYWRTREPGGQSAHSGQKNRGRRRRSRESGRLAERSNQRCHYVVSNRRFNLRWEAVREHRFELFNAQASARRDSPAF